MKRNKLIGTDYSSLQISALTILRILVGWHFLYEGLYKVYTHGWTGKGYLESSIGPFSPIFNFLAGSETLLQISDLLNIFGLTLIGLCLFIGLFSKLSAYLGMLLLFFYYLSYPPFSGLTNIGFVEGNYWIVNRNLIEMGSLFVLAVFPSSHITGIDRFIYKYRKSKSKSKSKD